MRTNPSSETENNSTAETDEYYEELACQEEIYLERVEENLRAIAICELEVSQQAENIDELREYAALITN